MRVHQLSRDGLRVRARPAPPVRAGLLPLQWRAPPRTSTDPCPRPPPPHAAGPSCLRGTARSIAQQRCLTCTQSRSEVSDATQAGARLCTGDTDWTRRAGKQRGHHTKLGAGAWGAVGDAPDRECSAGTVPASVLKRTRKHSGASSAESFGEASTSVGVIVGGMRAVAAAWRRLVGY